MFQPLAYTALKPIEPESKSIFREKVETISNYGYQVGLTAVCQSSNIIFLGMVYRDWEQLTKAESVGAIGACALVTSICQTGNYLLNSMIGRANTEIEDIIDLKKTYKKALMEGDLRSSKELESEHEYLPRWADNFVPLEKRAEQYQIGIKE